MGRSGKRATKVRSSADFTGDVMRMALAKPRQNSSVFAWQLAQIYAARNAQMAGQFSLAAKLRDAMKTDDALFVAYTNRLAPVRCLKKSMRAARGSAEAESIANEGAALFGQEGIGLTQATESDILGSLVEHGVAFSVNDFVYREKRTDIFVRYFPTEHTRWDQWKQCFVARIDTLAANDGFFEVDIRHGDGRWTIYAKHEHEPWKYGALAAASLVWSRHAFAVRDWAKGSAAHGNAKIVGELPAGVPLQDENGITREAAAFLELLKALVSDDMPVGIRPAGSKADFITNNSTAWQVYAELINNAEKAAARIYQGTDALLGSQGGAPGVDIASLFGVATTLVQGDLQTLERGFREGVIEPWCALNFGDSTLAPRRVYLIPDADADAARESEAKRMKSLLDELKEQKDLGFDLSQEWVDGRAKVYGVSAPKLPVVVAGEKAPSIALAPTDIARVVSVNEARASAGLGALMLPGGGSTPRASSP